MSIKKAFMVLIPLIMFSGCFLVKDNSNVTNNMTMAVGSYKTGMIVMSPDCYDCDTFSITVRR